MSDLVDSTEIEAIVGIARHPVQHYARAVSAEQTVYVLHSHACLTSGIDLRDCIFSVALDRGIDVGRWTQDGPVRVHIEGGQLVPGASERCRVVSKYGHCDRGRGHSAEPGDPGHEISMDGTIVFRWTPGRAGWAEPNGGAWL